MGKDDKIRSFCMNHILIAGHLGSDPEVRFTANSQKVTTFRVASNTRKGGKDETTWFRVTVWGEQFDKMMPYLKKGSSIMAAGEMSKPEIYNDREGRPQISVNMTASSLMFSPFGKAEKQEQGFGQAAPTQAFSAPQQQQQQAMPQQAPPQDFATQMAAPSPFDQMTQGQGQGSGGFGDEEIPF
jgi:single-strand DNA-binding protein